jgi:hypothetical protein
MSIYKGLLMLEGYLTTVERVDDEPRGRGAGATEPRPTGGRRAAAPRAVPEPEPVSAETGCLSGGCC